MRLWSYIKPLPTHALSPFFHVLAMSLPLPPSPESLRRGKDSRTPYFTNFLWFGPPKTEEKKSSHMSASYWLVDFRLSVLIGYQLCPSKLYRAISVLIGWTAFCGLCGLSLKSRKRWRVSRESSADWAVNVKIAGRGERRKSGLKLRPTVWTEPFPNIQHVLQFSSPPAVSRLFPGRRVGRTAEAFSR